jgi:hypothetical protein
VTPPDTLTPVPVSITLDNRILTGPATTANMRIALGLWGDSGSGKTTLAATAPGVKLWIQFDPDGVLSLAGRDDVLVLDVSAEPHGFVKKFESDNPLGLDKFLQEHPEVETVVIDSVTSYAFLALQNAVSNTLRATLERPGIPGYSYRNTVVLRMIVSLMKLTHKHNRHVIFITHEASPETDDDGNITSITLALNKGASNQLCMKLNEVWHLRDDGKTHTLSVRPCRQRRPMKTRMFDAQLTPEFNWVYNPITHKGDTIAGWFNAWKTGGGAKMPLPGTATRVATTPTTTPTKLAAMRTQS